MFFDAEVIIKVECLMCNKIAKADEANYICDDCEYKCCESTVKEAVISASNKTWEWEDRDNFEGYFETDKEKDCFFNGVKYGYKQALFWILDHVNDDGTLYEELVHKKTRFNENT